MWEAARANRRRSALLFALMALVLVTLGTCVGMAWIDSYLAVEGPDRAASVLVGGLWGAGVALVVWLFSVLIARFAGDRLILHSAGGRLIAKEDHPRLWNTVEEMKIASGLTRMPRVYIVEDSSPNAFAVGRTVDSASVAVTSGLLRLLNRDELQGVVAHEIGHIQNEDVRFMTAAATLVGAVELVARMFIHLGPLAGGGRRSSRGRGGSGPLMAIAVVVALISPLLVRLLYYACSRSREYLADASAARYTRYPEGLASALEKMSVHYEGAVAASASSTLGPLYIVNPHEVALSGMASTHPPTDRRIRVLRAMGGGAGYVDYAAALATVESDRSGIGALEAAARSGERVAVRAANSEADTAQSGIKRAQEVADLVDRMAGYIPFVCVCGLSIRVPPDFSHDDFCCPRCNRKSEVPHAEAETEALPTVAKGAQADALRYERRSPEWDAFKCRCGQVIQLGPEYPLDYTVCVNCNTRIEIRKEAA